MNADRYLKFILTVIACELLWFGVRDGAPPVAAQEKPMPVVLTGFRIDKQDYTTIPVAVVGAWQTVSGFRETHLTQPLKVQVTDPIRIDSRQPVTIQQPLTVQTGQQPFIVQTGTRPLSVESVPARPGPRPGL